MGPWIVAAAVLLASCGGVEGSGVDLWDDGGYVPDGGSSHAGDGGSQPGGGSDGGVTDAGSRDAGLPACVGDEDCYPDEYCADGSCEAFPESDPRLHGITRAHNLARAHAEPAPDTPLPLLAWAEDLAALAQGWAESCTWQHNPNRGQGEWIGENLYASSGTSTPEAVVESWVSEVADYDYATNTCTGVCGHYTQVVWRETTEVGCGVAYCDAIAGLSWPGEVWVCNYRPGGNYVGQRPY